MTLPRYVADVIAHHVVWELESIDRMYCNVYVPQLQREGGVVHFFRHHRGYPFASSVLMDPISKAFVAAIQAFVRTAGAPLITFPPHRRKEGGVDAPAAGAEPVRGKSNQAAALP
jgi:hypothetical protein